MADDPQAAPSAPPQGGDLVRRHRLSTRLWHWTNAITLAVMLMSGLMILNAHPRLYWGEYGANPDHAWLVLGGEADVPFPGWITIPAHYSPADARIWHFAFAVVLVAALLAYWLRSMLNGHIRRDLLPRLAELHPAHLWHDILDHARLKFPTGVAALDYNILQKLAYGSVLFVLLPLVIVTGMAMSPGLDAGLPWLTVVLGGRQSARSLHFLAAAGLVGFFLVHMAMVVLAGPINEVRSMLTGWYRLPREKGQ